MKSNKLRKNTKRNKNAKGNSGSKGRLLSFVIPVMNENETLDTLLGGIAHNVPANCEYEVIFVDDGSTDGSWEIIQTLAEIHPDHVRGLRFRSNRGKASALTAGFRAAKGDVVFTMDADLQDDPKEIPRFLAKLDEGYGLVSGWKQVRHDPWHKVLPSRVFNRMLSRFGKVKLHDHNCGFKCYQGSLAKSLMLFGELHRMVPSLATIRGYKVAEIVVQHHPREFGVSKYGIERFLRGFSDMLTIGFQNRFRERPSHGINGLAVGMLGTAAALAAVGLWSGVATVYGAMFVLFGLVFVAMSAATVVTGQLSEMVIRGQLKNDWTQTIVADTGTKEKETSGEERQSSRSTSWESTGWLQTVEA